MRTAVGIVVVLLAVASASCHANLPAASTQNLSRHTTSKVRGADPRAQALIDRAEKASPTISDLLLALQPSDLVVLVQVKLIPLRAGGRMQMLAATPACRYLLIRLDAKRSPQEQTELLGHELQHAREVADAPEVRDQPGLARLMARIGRQVGSGTFETDAAVRVSRQVGREIARK